MAGFIFGRPINESTQKALERKQTLVGTRIASRGGFSGLAREFFNIRTPWVKLSSAVAITDQAKQDYFGQSSEFGLAATNILYSVEAYGNEVLTSTRNLSEYYGGELGLRKDYVPGTVSYEDYGPRPRPGITGVTVTSHGMYGALRTVTVNFKCWTPYQLDIMDHLYMRPGYTMLLEFGHSHYLAGGNFDFTIEDDILPVDLYGTGYLSSEANDFDKVYDDVQNKKSIYGGAYEGFLGIVKNFSWAYTADGGYDCSIDLVSKGEVIESITVNAGASVTLSGNLTETTALGRTLQGLKNTNDLIEGQSSWYALKYAANILDKQDQSSTEQNFSTYYKQRFNTG